MVGIKLVSLHFCVAWIATCRNSAAATFRWHADAITSVEWHPTDESVLAVSGADDQLTLWDLSLEKDTEADAVRRDVAEVPAQLLFIHQVRDNQSLSRSRNATIVCANLLPRSVNSCADPRAKPTSRSCTGTGSFPALSSRRRTLVSTFSRRSAHERVLYNIVLSGYGLCDGAFDFVGGARCIINFCTVDSAVDKLTQVGHRHCLAEAAVARSARPSAGSSSERRTPGTIVSKTGK